MDRPFVRLVDRSYTQPSSGSSDLHRFIRLARKHNRRDGERMKKNYIYWLVGLVVVYLVWKNYQTSQAKLSASASYSTSTLNSLQDDGLDLVQEGIYSFL